MKVINKIPSLDGLRALSIFLVLIGHFVYRLGDLKIIYQYTYLNPFIVFVSDAHLGVKMFFVISGFLITYLLIKEERKNGKINFKNFYIRRTLRIFPAYYFVLFIYFVLQLLGHFKLEVLSWLSAITYTKYFYMTDWFTGHMWSLSVEEHFYLFWPILFILIPKSRINFQWILVALVPLLRIYVHYYPVSWISETSLFLTVDSLAIGCLFAFYHDIMLLNLKKSKKILFFVSILILTTYMLWGNILDNFTDNEIILLMNEVLVLSLTNFAIVFIIFYSVHSKDSLWFKFLNLKWLSFIGVLSYSIYLWQQIFINNTPYFYNKFPYNIIGIVVMALFSYYVIEKPFLKLKDKFNATKSNDK